MTFDRRERAELYYDIVVLATARETCDFPNVFDDFLTKISPT